MDPGAWNPIFGSEPLYGSSPCPPCNGLGLWTLFSDPPPPPPTSYLLFYALQSNNIIIKMHVTILC